MHWHAQAVSCLSCTEDAGYLLSGGQEGVLVMWQLESGYRQFLPRLGGPIVALANSSCGTIVAVQCKVGSFVAVVCGGADCCGTHAMRHRCRHGGGGGAADRVGLVSNGGGCVRRGLLLRQRRVLEAAPALWAYMCQRLRKCCAARHARSAPQQSYKRSTKAGANQQPGARRTR
jgi:hypothetical protein